MASFSHDTVAPTDFQRGSVDDLASYAEREEDAELRNRHGEPMSASEKQQLIDRSEDHQMSRHIIVSPENADQLDREQMSTATKQTMQETIGQREGVEYGYSVHMEGGDRPHSHVVATGKADNPGDPLWLDQDDLEELSNTAHDRAIEQDHGIDNALDDALEESIDQTRGHDQGRA